MKRHEIECDYCGMRGGLNDHHSGWVFLTYFARKDHGSVEVTKNFCSVDFLKRHVYAF